MKERGSERGERTGFRSLELSRWNSLRVQPFNVLSLLQLAHLCRLALLVELVRRANVTDLVVRGRRVAGDAALVVERRPAGRSPFLDGLEGEAIVDWVGVVGSDLAEATEGWENERGREERARKRRAGRVQTVVDDGSAVALWWSRRKCASVTNRRDGKGREGTRASKNGDEANRREEAVSGVESGREDGAGSVLMVGAVRKWSCAREDRGRLAKRGGNRAKEVGLVSSDSTQTSSKHYERDRAARSCCSRRWQRPEPSLLRDLARPR